jgi:hypothetical protein
MNRGLRVEFGREDCNWNLSFAARSGSLSLTDGNEAELCLVFSRRQKGNSLAGTAEAVQSNRTA